jgi:hypothetical protein
MPLWHCKECHHEWESVIKQNCDWCGEGCYMLEEQTSFERMIADWQAGKLDRILEEKREKHDSSRKT